MSKDNWKEPLAKANGTRFKRADLKRDIKQDPKLIIDAIQHPPEWLKTMRVVDLLIIIPLVGKIKAVRYINDCHMTTVTTVGGMTQRQRDLLVNALK